MSALPALLALVLVVLAVAGCGPFAEAEEVPVETIEDRAVYEEEVRAVYAAVRAASERLAEDTAPAQLETQLEDALGRLQRADPPEDAMPEHEELARALREAADLGGALAAAGEPRPVEELEQLRQALDRAEDALAGLEAKGYDVRRRT